MTPTMKQDHYLNLCLEQAALSPLHYRHGAIVVKGGKVLGRGFNAQRRGYDGGALKTGALPRSSFPAHHPSTPILSTKPKPGFVPFERTGSTAPFAALSMHSEMAAIADALGTGTTKARGAPCGVKPIPNASRHTSATSSPQPKGGTFNKAPAWLRHVSSDLKLHLDAVACREQLRRPSSLPERRPSNGKQQEKEQKQEHKNEDQNGYNGFNNKRTKSLKKQNSMNARTKGTDHRMPRTKHVVVPRRQSSSSHAVSDRKKNPRLIGADLYVTRIAKDDNREPPHEEALLPGVCEVASTPTGSLYDELICKTSKAKPNATASEHIHRRDHTPVESRPCYRCVAHMHSVGIKRVFWTNVAGQWEGAKVRDLMHEIERGGTSGDDGEPRVFVTKHEVLRMLRLTSVGR